MIHHHHLALLLLPMFGHALADARCEVFVSNNHVNASIVRSDDFTGVQHLWFYAANGTNFTLTMPREHPLNISTATFITLKTGWIKTTLDWPVGTYWEHEGTISIPSVSYLKGDDWVTQLTINMGDKPTPRMVVASSDPMIWIKQKSCDITSLDPKIFIGESSCPSYSDVSSEVAPTIVTTTTPIPTAADTTAAPTVPTTAAAPAAVPTAAANICLQTGGSSSNSSSIALLTVLLVLVSLGLILLSVYTYRLRNQLGITGAHVSFQPLKNDGTTMPRRAPNGSQNSLHDVSVPLH